MNKITKVARTAVLLIAGFPLFHTSLARAESPKQDVVRLQLSSPRIIKDALVTYENHRSNQLKYFQIRYQTNAYVIREVASIDPNSSNFGAQSGFFIGKFNDDYWTFNLSGNLKRWHGTYEAGKEPNAVLNLHLVQQQILNGFFSLGIQAMLPGTAIWTDDSFKSLKRLPDDQPNLYRMLTESGTIMANPDTGITDRLRYHIENDSYVEVRLKYQDTPEFQGFPYTYTSWYIKDGAERKMYTFTISKIEFSDTPLPREQFEPDMTLLGGPVTELVYTNGAVLWNRSPDKANPNFVPVDRERYPAPDEKQVAKLHPNVWFLLLFGIGPAICIVALIRVKRKERQQQKATPPARVPQDDKVAS